MDTADDPRPAANNPAPASDQNSQQEEKQCRICLDGPDPALGRLIRPCLCRGSMAYVHLHCLKLWMNSPTNRSAFYACPNCKYEYRYSRTRVSGIAANPIIVGFLSSLLFTAIVLCASFVSTWIIGDLDESTATSSTFYSGFLGYGYGYWVNPWDVAKDLIRAAFRILTDQADILDDELFSRSSRPAKPIILGSQPAASRPPAGLLKRLLKRFLLGLPVVGAASLIQLISSFHMLTPTQWIARARGNRDRRGSSRDLAAVIIVALLLIGVAKAIYTVYRFTEKLTKKLLLRAEDAILEVSG